MATALSGLFAGRAVARAAAPGAFPTAVAGGDLLRSRPVSVTADGARALVVIFLSAKCPCSDSHTAEIKRLEKDFPEFRFVGVHSNGDEAPESARPYFSKIDLPFPIVQDEHFELADRFRAFKTPHAFVISPTGEMLYQGGVTDSHVAPDAKKHFLQDALAAVRAGQNPPLAQTRTLGCMITR